MKLYLTSYRIPDLQALADLVGKPPAKTRVGLIPNAKDYYVPRALRVKTRDLETYLKALGFQVSVIDLKMYTNPAQLDHDLRQVDLLWVMGGNTFCLREAMRRSGFDRVVKGVLEAGVIYAGESSGACVAGPDLHGVELADDAEFAETVIWKGLGLVPAYIVPHADNKDFGDIMQSIIAQRSGDPNLVVLNDNQAWVANGAEAWKITGAKPANV